MQDNVVFFTDMKFTMSGILLLTGFYFSITLLILPT